jgi:cytochrome c oxidase subunit 2
MENLKELLSMVVPVEWLFSVMPIGASQHATALDQLFWFLLVTTGIFFLLIVVPLAIFIVIYRRKHPNQRALSQVDHNFWLESLWTFLPFIYLAFLFVWGFNQFLGLYVAPNNAMELRVIGQKWSWSIDYPEEEINVAGAGAVIGVPVGVPIKLIMSSQDVIHSFFIPNMRVKQDVVPGRYSTLWFQADRVGEYPIFCAEYCGDLHSQMLSKLKVMPMATYKEWVDKIKQEDQKLPLPELGKKLYSKLGCVACHSTDGSIKLAPSFKDLYGSREQLTSGGTVIVNDDYIRQSILEPQKQVTKGYAPVMPTFQGRVSEREISGLIAFIKSLAKRE